MFVVVVSAESSENEAFLGNKGVSGWHYISGLKRVKRQGNMLSEKAISRTLLFDYL